MANSYAESMNTLTTDSVHKKIMDEELANIAQEAVKKQIETTLKDPLFETSTNFYLFVLPNRR